MYSWSVESICVLCLELYDTTDTFCTVVPMLCPCRVREYLADLESKIAKSGSKVVKLDEDGNVTTASGPSSSDNAMSK